MNNQALKLLEKHVVKQCEDFLKVRQWRTFKNNPLVATVVGTGRVVSASERGMADRTYVRYLGDKWKQSPVALLLHVEYKKLGEEPKPHQAEWHRNERLLGALVWVVDSYEDFQTRYFETFGWLHAGKHAVGQCALFSPLPDDLRPTG